MKKFNVEELLRADSNSFEITMINSEDREFKLNDNTIVKHSHLAWAVNAKIIKLTDNTISIKTKRCWTKVKDNYRYFNERRQ